MKWNCTAAFGCVIMISYFIQLSAGTVCVAFEETSVCGDVSKWAVNTPNVSVSHHVGPITKLSFNIYYRQASVLLCDVIYSYTGSCEGQDGPNCGSCVNNYTDYGTVTANFFITNLNITMNESVLTYELQRESIGKKTLHKFELQVCPRTVGNATATDYPELCGYGCSSKFVCHSPHVYNPASTMGYNKIYRCSATAVWTPSVPSDLCILDDDAATSDSSMDPTNTTTGAIYVTFQFECELSRIVVGFIGGVNIVVSIAFQLCMVAGLAMTLLTRELRVLHGAFICCTCIWAVALGVVCMGVAGNDAPFFAGIGIGSLSILGMVVVNVLYGLQIKKHKYIKGKRTEDVSMK